MKIDIDYIKQVADLMHEKSLIEVSIEDGDKKFSLKKSDVCIAQQVISQPVSVVSSAPSEVVQESVKPASKGTPITSPMVGTFYSSSAPGEEPYVKVGDVIRSGQIVCIIEAMKLMNEIEADVSGRITEICVENGETIEFGQVLMYIE